MTTTLAAAGAFLESAFRYLAVIVLLVMVPFLRLPFVRGRMDTLVVRAFARVPQRHRLRAILLATVATTPVISLGSVAVLGAIFRRRSRPELAAPQVVMRGVVATMLWAPTTAAVALVMHRFPDVSWGSALRLGVPLSLLCLGVAAATRGSVGDDECAAEAISGDAPTSPLLLTGVALTAVTAAGHWIAGLTLTDAVSVSALALTLLWFVAFERLPALDAVRVVHDQMRRTWTQGAPEVALFVATGCFTAALGGLDLHLDLTPGDALLRRLLVPAVILGVPLITALGVHPIVPFSVLSGVMTRAALGLSDVALYTMWIVVFMLSMLVSPVSVLNVMSAASFEISPWHLGLRAHWRYALIAGCLATALLWLVQ